MKRSYLKILAVGAICIYGGNKAQAEVQQHLESAMHYAGSTVKSGFNTFTNNLFDMGTAQVGQACSDSARDSSLAGFFSSNSVAINPETANQQKLDSTTRTFQFTVEGILTGFRHEFIENPQSFKRIIATAGTAKAAQTAANLLIPGSGTAGRLVARGIGTAVSAAIKSAAKGRSTNAYAQISLSDIENMSTTVAEGLIAKYGPLVLAFETNRLNDFLSHLAWRVEAVGRHLLEKNGSLDGQSILHKISDTTIKYRRPPNDRLKSEVKGLVQGSLSKGKIKKFLAMTPEEIEKTSAHYATSNDTVAKVVKKTIAKVVKKTMRAA